VAPSHFPSDEAQQLTWDPPKRTHLGPAAPRVSHDGMKNLLPLGTNFSFFCHRMQAHVATNWERGKLRNKYAR